MRIAAHAVRVWFLYPKQADMSTRPETGRRGTGLPVPLREGAVYAFSNTSLSRRKRPKTADAAAVIQSSGGGGIFRITKNKRGFPVAALAISVQNILKSRVSHQILAITPLFHTRLVFS